MEEFREVKDILNIAIDDGVQITQGRPIPQWFLVFWRNNIPTSDFAEIMRNVGSRLIDTGHFKDLFIGDDIMTISYSHYGFPISTGWADNQKVFNYIMGKPKWGYAIPPTQENKLIHINEYAEHIDEIDLKRILTQAEDEGYDVEVRAPICAIKAKTGSAAYLDTDRFVEISLDIKNRLQTLGLSRSQAFEYEYNHNSFPTPHSFFINDHDINDKQDILKVLQKRHKTRGTNFVLTACVYFFG